MHRTGLSHSSYYLLHPLNPQLRTLDRFFPGWIGRRGEVEWPVCSPDLTPQDFGLWGYLKDRVFARNPKIISELKQIITEEVDALNQDRGYLVRLLRHVAKRCQVVQEVGGGPLNNICNP